MNLLQLILKGMRQRALGTALTMLSVMLGVALATAVLIALRESDRLFVQTEYGYDVIVGPKGSPTQLVLNTVYGIDRSPGNIPYSVYESLSAPRHPFAKLAIPIAVGDSYEGLPIVGTTARMFNADETGSPLPAGATAFEYRPQQRYTLSAGRFFHDRKFEGVIGSEVATRTGLKLGDLFHVTHGMPAAGATPDIHEQQWTVVGILAPTQTAADRNLYIPLVSFWSMSGHEDAMVAQMNLRNAAEGKPPIPTRGVPESTEPAGQDHAGPDAHDAADIMQNDTPAHDHAADDADRPADHADPAPADAHADHADPAPAAGTPMPDAHDAASHGGDTHSADPQTTADDGPHDHAHAYHVEPDGQIVLELPKESLLISAVLVRARGDEQRGFATQSLIYGFNNLPVAAAVNPAAVMREFFQTFFRGSSLVLLAVSVLVTLVAAVGILVSIYNSIAARRREIATLRALGASRTKILSVICGEAALIGLIGGILGLILGHAIAAVGSAQASRLLGSPIAWHHVGALEWLYLLGTVLLATLAGLVPALAAYRTPVATHLAGE